jgi:hypothetical protein
MSFLCKDLITDSDVPQEVIKKGEEGPFKVTAIRTRM